MKKRIAVVCAVIADGNRFLACRRAPDQARGGFWEFPGGKVETDERPREALARELREELGIDVSVGREFGSNTHEYDDVTVSLSAYLCTARQKPASSTDHDEIRWVTAQEAAGLSWAPADVPLLEAYTRTVAEPELWDVLDAQGRPTGRVINRGQRLADGEYHRVVHIWIADETGRFLIQKRSPSVEWMPGMWAGTGGSVVCGERSLDAAMRELHEELGLSAAADDFRLIGTTITDNSIVDVWSVDGRTLLPAREPTCDEVSETAWADAGTISGMVKAGTFVDYGAAYFTLLFSAHPAP